MGASFILDLSNGSRQFPRSRDQESALATQSKSAHVQSNPRQNVKYKPGDALARHNLAYVKSLDCQAGHFSSGVGGTHFYRDVAAFARHKRYIVIAKKRWQNAVAAPFPNHFEPDHQRGIGRK